MSRSIACKAILPTVLAAAICATACAQAAPKKKLIQFGWDMKSPAYLQKSIGDLQHLPFDGLTVRDTRFCYTFYNKPISEADVQKTIEIVKNIPWGKFTDNFIYTTAADLVDWLDDAWKDATVLGPFKAHMVAPEYKLAAKTRARATFDKDNLYVAFRCREPDMKTTRKGYSNRFDDVSVILAPAKNRKAWRVFSVGANKKRKDMRPGAKAGSWKPTYQSAVRLVKGEWSVEMAIPWKTLGRDVPNRGEKLAANVAHMRFRARDAQYATWSKFRGKPDGRPAYIRVEPDHLGTWIFE